MNQEKICLTQGPSHTYSQQSQDIERETFELEDTMSSEGGSVNEALVQVGTIGKYQLYMLFWALLGGILTSMQSLDMVFTQADVGFRCADSTEEGITPVMYTGSKYNTTMSNQSVYGACEYPNTTIECSSFVYNSSVYKSTTVSEFDLVCSKSIWNTVVNMLFMLSRIPGGLIVGQALDRGGRKKTLVAGLFLIGAFGLGTAYSVNIAMYIVFRALTAVPIMAVYDGFATFLSEVTTPRQRPQILIAMVFSWGSGICLISLFAYFIRDWRTLHMAVTVPSFLLCFIMFWVADESPHWLYSQNKYKEAQKVIEKIARWNNCSHKLTITLTAVDATPLSPQDSESEAKLEPELGPQSIIDVSEPKQSQCAQIVKNKRFLAIFCICAFGWLACNMGYSGLALGLGSLSGDTYIINLIGGATELVSYVIAFLVIPGGRKLIYILLLAFGGVGLISSAVVQDLWPEINWLVIATTMVGRLSVAAGWQILYLWCIELFPTTIRVTTLEVSQWLGHIGSTAAPFINDLTKVIKNPNIKGGIIAPAVYGTLLIISSVLSFYLPETNNKSLPVNIEEATSNTDSERQKENKWSL